MNINQIWGTARWALSFGGGFLVARGYLSSRDLTTVISETSKVVTAVSEVAGPIAAVAAIVWSMVNHTKASTVAKAANIVTISPFEQKKAGITSPVMVPTDPPSPSKTVL